MAPRGAKLEPQGPPKYQQDTKMYPKVQKCRRRCHNGASRSCAMPQRHHEATHSGNYALGKTLGCKKLVKTARQFPAAGSRDEPTRLQVEGPVVERKQAFEVQVHNSFVVVIN